MAHKHQALPACSGVVVFIRGRRTTALSRISLFSPKRQHLPVYQRILGR